jgi:hypothetical protein
MKLTGIKAVNLTCHRLTQIELTKTVNLFVGPSEAGKSTLAEAVAVALTGWPIRLRRPKDVPFLLADPKMTGEARVRVDEGKGSEPWYGGPIHAGKTPAMKTVKPNEVVGPEIIQASFELRRVLDMEPEKRKGILMRILGLEDADCMRAFCHDKLGFMAPVEVSDHFPNIKKATEAAVDLRREAKRELALIDGTTKVGMPHQVVTMGDQTFDMEKITAGMIEGSLKGLRDQLFEEEQELTKYIFCMRRGKEKKGHYEKGLADHGEKPPFSESEISGVEGTLQELRDSLQREIEVEATIKAHISMAKKGGRCPILNQTCRRVEGSDEELKAMISTLEKDLSVKVRNIAELQAGIKDTGDTLQKMQGANRVWKGKDEQLAELKADMQGLSDEMMKTKYKGEKATEVGEYERILRKKYINPLQDRIATGEKVLAHYNLYEKAKETMGGDVAGRRKALDEAIEKADRLAKYLAENLRNDLLEGSIGQLRERITMTTARALPGHGVSVTDDLDVVVDGRPIEILSESERYRVGFCIQEAFSYLSGLKFLMVDRMEILRGDFQKEFINLIIQIADNHDTILLFATADEKPKGAPPGFDIFWVEAGEVTRMFE